MKQILILELATNSYRANFFYLKVELLSVSFQTLVKLHFNEVLNV